ncbi:glutathione binding-like protein [Vibrio sp. M60_M31a]
MAFIRLVHRRCQDAYEEAVNKVFDMLDELEVRLEGQDYLVGNQLKETGHPYLCYFDSF